MQKLKLAYITPLYKKDDMSKVKNYGPVSVFSTVSEIFKRLMQKQRSKCINLLLSPCVCGYRKGFVTETALFWLIEKWNASLIRTVFLVQY